MTLKINWGYLLKFFSSVFLIWILSEAPPAMAADYDNCSWYYDFYCTHCADVGKPTTGTLGPFPSSESCEHDRTSLEDELLKENIFSNSTACYQYSSCYYPVPLDLYPPEERQRMLHMLGF